MKNSEVQLNRVYAAKVSGKLVPVRIQAEWSFGNGHYGWIGRNEETGREVRIKTAARLRYEMPARGLEAIQQWNPKGASK